MPGSLMLAMLYHMCANTLSLSTPLPFSYALPDLPPKAVPPRVLVQAPPFGWGVVQEAEVG